MYVQKSFRSASVGYKITYANLYICIFVYIQICSSLFLVRAPVFKQKPFEWPKDGPLQLSQKLKTTIIFYLRLATSLKTNVMIGMQEILDLSVTERIQMIEKIWDSIDDTRIKMPDTLEKELDRRLGRYEKGETTFTSWESIRNELQQDKTTASTLPTARQTF